MSFALYPPPNSPSGRSTLMTTASGIANWHQSHNVPPFIVPISTTVCSFFRLSRETRGVSSRIFWQAPRNTEISASLYASIVEIQPRILTRSIVPAGHRYQRTMFSAGQELNTRRCYLFSGGIFLIGAENTACLTGSTGLCFIVVLAGSFPRKLSPCQFLAGLIGRGTNPPPQLG